MSFRVLSGFFWDSLFIVDVWRRFHLSQASTASGALGKPKRRSSGLSQDDMRTGAMLRFALAFCVVSWLPDVLSSSCILHGALCFVCHWSFVPRFANNIRGLVSQHPWRCFKRFGLRWDSGNWGAFEGWFGHYQRVVLSFSPPPPALSFILILILIVIILILILILIVIIIIIIIILIILLIIITIIITIIIIIIIIIIVIVVIIFVIVVIVVMSWSSPSSSLSRSLTWITLSLGSCAESSGCCRIMEMSPRSRPSKRVIGCVKSAEKNTFYQSVWESSLQMLRLIFCCSVLWSRDLNGEKHWRLLYMVRSPPHLLCLEVWRREVKYTRNFWIHNPVLECSTITTLFLLAPCTP